MKLQQPKALYILNFVSMWECFSYYGMRVLLVLFMIQELRFSESKALAVYAMYITCIELGGLFGGFVADRFLGLKRSVAIGGWTIMGGHILLGLSNSHPAFFGALGIIILGTAFFRTNITALIGTLYSEEDPRREAGYTLFYTGINVGGFLASIFCGIVGEAYGWHAGFGLAAIGMLTGNLVFVFSKKMFEEKKELSECFVKENFFKNFKENFSENRQFKSLFLYILFLIIFYACEEQLGSTLILFSENYVNRETIWGTLPSSSLITINPLTILLAGPLLYRLLQKFIVGEMAKIASSFIFLGSAFLVLTLGCFYSSFQGTIPLNFALISIFLIGIGELFIGPTIYAAASKSVPKSMAGIAMGIVTLGYALANLVSGLISELIVNQSTAVSMEYYSRGFSLISAVIFCLAILILILTQRKKVYA